MSRARLAAVVVGALAAAGCYGSHSFNCAGDDTRCSTGERCLAERCAARDPSCAGGFRFTSSAGDLAGSCLGSPPDGGVGCVGEGAGCDDGDPCTDGDTCVKGICQGTPKRCGASTCAAGVQSTPTCVAGTCMPQPTPCTPYPCAGARCATGCATASDCQAGFYCASGKCLSCGDYLANASYVPMFGPPSPIPTVNAMNAVDAAPFLSPDGLWLYFASGRPGGQGGLDLYRANRPTLDGAWSAPLALAGLNSAADDVDPFTLDGKIHLLASDRGAPGDFNLLTSTFDKNLFSTPVDLPGGDLAGPLTTPSRELHPTLPSDGKRLYFASDRGSPAVADPLFHIFFASRASGVGPFGTTSQLAGLDPLGAFASPSVSAGGGALFVVNAAVPSRAEAAMVHLDAGGAPTGQTTVVHGIDLTGGGEVALSSDGCTMLYSNHRVDPLGDLAWSTRTSLIVCGAATCGLDDGCCPAGCPNLLDSDCAYPRTVELSEYAAMGGAKHAYLLDGEIVPAGYTPTGSALRVFRDSLPGTVALNRYLSMACDGTPYHYLALASDPARDVSYVLDRVVGYVAPTLAGKRGVARLYRAIKESLLCDEQLLFDPNACTNLMANQGYTCDAMSGYAFAVKP